MRAGRLRQYITIEQPPTGQDAAGQPLTTWTVFAYAYARISPINGAERFDADANRNPLTHEIEIRYISGISPDMRVLFDGRYFNIVAIRNTDERNAQMFLDCVEGLSNG